MLVEPDDDPPPRGWNLCGDPTGAGEDRSTARRHPACRPRFPLEGLTPGQMARHRRNCVLIAALAGGAPLAWVAEAFGVCPTRAKDIRKEYREKFHSPPGDD